MRSSPVLALATTLLTAASCANSPLWMRIEVTDVLVSSGDGRGPKSGYGHGETEDYLLSPLVASWYGPD